MDRLHSVYWAVALTSVSIVWSSPIWAQTTAGDDAKARQAMQQQLDALKSQLQQLRQQSSGSSSSQGQPQGQPQGVNAEAQSLSGDPATDDASVEDQAGASSDEPEAKLSLGGAYTAGYKLTPDLEGDQRTGGDGVLGITAFNATGKLGGVTYGAEYRWSQTAFADEGFLRYGWAAYDFADHHQVKGGLFYVPFGNLKYGYQSFWGNLTYFAGFTDNQAAGVGYKYENGPWRVDVDAFKNDDLQQHSLYGSNPFEGYQQINGGNVRLAYTFNPETEHSVQISTAVRGGQLQVGERESDYGTRWAATVAADAALGPWTFQGQYVDYRYNIPGGRTFDGNVLPTDSITVENYGFGYQMPASGQIFAANIARTFDISWGALDSIQLYNNYGYLLVGGDGQFNSALPNPDGTANPTGDIQFNALGANFSFGVLQIWADVLTGKNSAMTFDGPNDGSWNTRYNLQMGVYFSGDVVKN